MNEGYPGLQRAGRLLYTKNLGTGPVYKERILKRDGTEYRLWSPMRSKLAAFILKGGRHFPFSPSSRVLYLGAASGTTASHISDLVPQGEVYCVENSLRAGRGLVALSRQRPNILPLLTDARFPERYAPIVGGRVDVVYQDIAQRDQAAIFLKNAGQFLGAGGWGVMMIKSRSIDMAAAPPGVFSKVREEVARRMDVAELLTLEPFQRDHAALVGRWKGEPRTGSA